MMNPDKIVHLDDTYFEEVGVWPHGKGVRFTYIIGFVLSIILTLAAYFLATHAPSSTTLWVLLLVFAVAQFVVQITCFVHLGAERSSRDRLVIFGCAALIVGIVTVGSLWIMTTLNGRMMPDNATMNAYMNDQNGGI